MSTQDKSLLKVPPVSSTLQESTVRAMKFDACLWVAFFVGLVWWSVMNYGTELTSIYLWRDLSREESTQVRGEFSWNQIMPATSLNYTSCFGGFQCARLDVPLNWDANAAEDGSRAAIAIVRLPAKVPVTDMRYGGAILMNPGGPGESGIYQVLSGGKSIQAIVDSPTPPSAAQSLMSRSSFKYFDIIGFDPRGVNNTTPQLQCFPNGFAQQTWDIQVSAEGLLGSSDTAFDLSWARSRALAESCSQDCPNKGILRYINTAQVVQDMVEIIEKHGEWREREAEEILETFDIKGNGTVLEVEGKDIITNRVRWEKGKEKLQFWGFSYGTILGATFAAMHPQRVHRVTIDGVVDFPDYYQTEWQENLGDTDTIITKFCEYCHEAGPKRCPLFVDTSPKDVEQRIVQILAYVKRNPLPVPGSGKKGPEIVTFSDIMIMIHEALYEPYREAESLFQILAEIDNNNGSGVADLKQKRWIPVAHTQRQQLSLYDSFSSNNYVSHDGATQGIVCMDGESVAQATKEEFREYARSLKHQSKWLGDAWAQVRMGCIGWSARPAWTFKGPIAANTSHPLLMIGNTLDPVTPLRNAYSAREKFPGAVVLQHDAEGHCSYSSPSLCTGKSVREYFQTGTLPEAGRTCPPETRPFLGCLNKDANGNCEALGPEDERMVKAMETLASVWT